MKERAFTGDLAIVASQKQKEKAYWLNQLSGTLVRSSFFTNTARVETTSDAVPSHEAIWRCSFPETLANGLLRLSKDTDARLHILLCAGVLALLQKYTGYSDLIVGTPIYKQDKQERLINTVLPVRCQLEKKDTFKSFLFGVGKSVVEAVEHRNYPFEILLRQLEIPVTGQECPLFDCAVVLESIQDIEYIQYLKPSLIFSFSKELDAGSGAGSLTGSVYYSQAHYAEGFIEQVVTHLFRLMEGLLAKPETAIGDITILSAQELKELIEVFNSTDVDYPRDTVIHGLFEKQVDKTPQAVALKMGEQVLSYAGLEKEANQVSQYLLKRHGVEQDEAVGILMDRSADAVRALLGILKAGAAYVPLEPNWPEERMKVIIHDAGIRVVLSTKKFIRVLNRLQWDCPSFHTYLCMDSRDAHGEDEREKSELMDESLWNYVAETAGDDIAGGGWNSSYTGKPFSRLEMDEYGENVLKKVEPFLHQGLRVLEIGCASGISMFRIAPRVGLYYGTDLSHVIIEKNKQRVQTEGFTTIQLAAVPAHEVDTIGEKEFDLIIINSVIQSFHGHNYLRKVIQKCVSLLNQRGLLFLGDIMDNDLKPALIQDLHTFKREHRDSQYKTKTEWSTELFVSRGFFRDLALDIPGILDMESSEKIHTVENELTKFRYDMLIRVDKGLEQVTGAGPAMRQRQKYQEDSRDLEKYGTGRLEVGVRGRDLAYIIYTSGTTGNPKGVMVEHQGLVNYSWWAVKQYMGKKVSAMPFYTTLSFDLTVTSIFPPLISGNTIVIYDTPQERLPIQAVMSDGWVDVVKATPSHLKIIQGSSEVSHIGREVRAFVVGGEQLDAVLAREIDQRFPGGVEIYNEYGPTEATVGCMIYRFDREKDLAGAVPIGVPMDNSRIYILDDTFQPVPVGGIGEIYIGGDGLARGYVNRPHLTAEKFLGSPFEKGKFLYRSGDLAVRRLDGNIIFLGRKDQQVKIRGYRIEIAEIENRLQEHPGIRSAIVIDRQDENGNTSLCAYVVGDRQLEVGELVEYLSTQLPDYMIPAYFVPLDNIPLTANNKVDRKKLPAPETHFSTGIAYEKPRTEIEKIVADIWSEVLGIERIGINDNFFQVGGDSIKIIQVSARLHSHHLTTGINHLFNNPTIKQLAPFIKPVNREISQETVTGEVYLTPIQCWFFQAITVKPSHFNQSVMLFRQEGFNEQIVLEVLKGILHHHDALRMVYKTASRGIVQENRGMVHGLFELTVKWIWPGEDIPGIIEREAGHIQGLLHLSMGPMLEAGLFQTNAGDYLFIVIHHLVVDGVSWRIILEDFERSYRQLMGGEPLSFPGKTDSFRDWSRRLRDYASSPALLNELPYWKKLEAMPVRSLIGPVGQEHRKVKNMTTLTLEFSTRETARLLKEVNRAYNTEINDILLTALAISTREWTGVDAILVNLEGHGREAIFEDMNISRTVGWFATHFPVLLNLKGVNELSLGVKTVKETLRRVPNRGIGYGVLKYLTPAEKKAGVMFNLQPEIGFNFLGEFGAGERQRESLFTLSSLGTGRTVDLENEQHLLIDINGMVKDGILTFWFSYNTLGCDGESMAKWLGLYRHYLIQLIDHCAGKEGSEYTPDDIVSGEELSIEELDAIKEFTEQHIEDDE